MNIANLAQPKHILYILFYIVCLVFSACAKKEIASKQDIKTQIKSQHPSIPFALNKADSNKWYKEQFLPILKKSSSKKGAEEYERFAKLYFADLSQIQDYDKHVPQDKLLQSVSFTLFAQDVFREFLFLQEMGLIVAPWEAFASDIEFGNHIISASFVAKVADEIGQFENESYENLNNIVLAHSLLRLTEKYAYVTQTSKKTRDITEIAQYVLPDSLYSFLFYRIVYAKYMEKFQSNFILHAMSRQFPSATLQASNKILYVQPQHNNIKTMQKYFSFTSFEPTNPLAIMQCRSGSMYYPAQKACIQATFISWLTYLQFSLRRHNSPYVLPIFTDSKLCLLLTQNNIVVYPYNEGTFCKNLVATWQTHQAR
ncbi:hypothetical protein [Helicobacter trogontum]|uniref:Uncharacterized protein n=1 Tax=Helicobacter trogontum TaxID=50960 RepID=A0A4U8SCM7_9HELI|nr:hypothetical protein [Helicobacter trogontum]TLD83717.1 hypothetical protein LS81_004015 [Helicobacter trogontum]